jgi:hypothetical protein
MLTLRDAENISDIREWSDRACEDYRERTGHSACWFRLLANCNGKVEDACKAVLHPNDPNWLEVLTFNQKHERLHCSVEWAVGHWPDRFTPEERQTAHDRLSMFTP